MAENPGPAPAAPAAGPVSWRERLHSASWWIAVATAAGALLDAVTGMHVPSSALASIAGVVASLVLGTGVSLR